MIFNLDLQVANFSFVGSAGREGLTLGGKVARFAIKTFARK